MSRRNLGYANILALCGLAALVSLIALLTWDRFVETQRARQWVRHTYEVLNDLKSLGLALRDAETGQYGFLLTHDDQYLTPYDEALKNISRQQDDLNRLVSDNPAEQARLAELAPLIRERLDELAQGLDLYRAQGAAAAVRLIQGGEGLRLTGAIRSVLTQMEDAEQRLLASRLAEADTLATLTRWLTLGGTAISVLLLGFAVHRIISARREAEQAEAAQRRLAVRLRVVLDSLSQGIGVFDPSLILTHWNRCFQELLGLPSPMLREGTPYARFVDHAEAWAGAAFLETEAQIRQGRTLRSPNEIVVYERTRNDGRVLEIRRTGMPEGGFVLTVSDLTERAHAEAILREAQKMQAIGQLTGGIAHDFNNLLTVILGNLEIVVARLGGGHPVLPRVARAQWAAQRGATLTGHLLAFARKQPLEPKPLNLSDSLPDLTDLLKRTLGEPVELRIVDSAGLWPVLADAAQLESAVLNLALNARDAMPEGGRLTIEVANKVLDEDYARNHAEVSAGDYVMLAVSDTGHGMTREIKARVFEPFFTTKPDGKGTGLGLAMVYGFVKQSRGHVKVYSEPGEGTTVKIYLPRHAGTAASPAVHRSAPIALPRGDATVLVVEDEAEVRDIAVSFLRDLGYQVLDAANGDAALRLLADETRRIDLLLTDVVLPGALNGRAVAERAAAIRPRMRVLFMSGYTENAIVHHGRLDDGVHLIGKPFKREQLARKVAEVLGTAA